MDHFMTKTQSHVHTSEQPQLKGIFVASLCDANCKTVPIFLGKAVGETGIET